jgi:hypothetical protein
MLADTTGFYQQLTVQKDRIHYTEKRSIDLVIGSGNHGQAYLSWEGDHLYQMHVSYLTESDQWVNSPGMYVDGTADFARPVPGRCLDCHTTWFSEDATAVNRFDRSNYLLGVTCVRCHGPGHEHVAYHREPPDYHVIGSMNCVLSVIPPENHSPPRSPIAPESRCRSIWNWILRQMPRQMKIPIAQISLQG